MSPDDQRFSTRTAGAAAAFAMALGSVVLLGWTFGIPMFTSVAPGLPSMKPLTAWAFVLSGLSLVLCILPGWRTRARTLGTTAAGVVSVVGLATLVEYATGADLGFDRWMFSDALVDDPSFPTGRMAIPTALGFVSIGIALLMAHTGQPGTRFQAPSFAAVAIGLVTFAGYLYDVPVLGRFAAPSFGPFSSIALHTTIGLLVLGAAIPCTDPRHGLVGLLRSRGLAGSWARRLLPWVLVGPLLGAWLQLLGERHGLYRNDAGTAMFTVLNVLILIGMLWAGTASLARSIRDRDRARSAQRTVERSFRHMVETMQEGVWLLDADATITYVNQRQAEILGATPEQVVGRKLFDFVAPGERAAAEARFEQRRHGIRDSFDFRLRRLDGAEVWVLVSSNPFIDEQGRFGGTLATITDIHARKQAEARQALLISELDHRVKNTLATIVALLDETLTGSPSPQAFRSTFEGRVRALARAHEALARQHWGDLAMDQVVPLALAGASLSDPDRVEISGALALLPATTATPLLLALNELATNAARHGSLSSRHGRLAVTWVSRDDGWLELSWRESGGPATRAPDQLTGGLSLVGDVVRGQLGGTLELDFAESGLGVRIAFPPAIDPAVGSPAPAPTLANPTAPRR